MAGAPPSPRPALTLAGAEAELFVGVKVGRGAAPGQVVRAAVRGAGGVGLASEGEGEVAGGAICVSKVGLNHCRRTGAWVRAAWDGCEKKREWGPPWRGSGAHRCPCPETTTPHRRSGRLPECPGREERRVPGARSSHRRGIHLRALKKQMGRRESSGYRCADCAIPKGCWTGAGVGGAHPRAAPQTLRPRAVR